MWIVKGIGLAGTCCGFWKGKPVCHMLCYGICMWLSFEFNFLIISGFLLWSLPVRRFDWRTCGRLLISVQYFMKSQMNFWNSGTSKIRPVSTLLLYPATIFINYTLRYCAQHEHRTHLFVWRQKRKRNRKRELLNCSTCSKWK